MKYILSIVSCCIFLSLSLSAQTSLTGVWRGSFYNIREVMLGGTKYRYEVQIDNKGQGVRGVTYSYQTTRFYGKASMIGKWAPESNNLILMEDKMVDMRIEGGGEGCLMTCYLEYRKEGDTEYLEGTYTSKNMNNGTDCGGGRVRLEKVTDSDFEKEDFLKEPQKEVQKEEKKAAEVAKVKPGQEDFLVKKPAPKPSTPATTPKKTTTPPKTTVQKAPPKKPATTPASGVKPKVPPVNTTAKKPATKPPVKPNTPTPKPAAPPVSAARQKPVATKTPATETSKTDEKQTNKAAEEVVKTEPKPKIIIPKPAPPPVLKNRTNELFETISTDAREITISFYDNGEIDGDTISVYDNNKLIVSRRGLSANPIALKIKLNDDDPDHELVMVAENLGSIPPNTALMIVQAGSKRYTLRLSSTEQKNAMVKFRYEAKTP